MSWVHQKADLEAFEALDDETRALVLRLLDQPGEAEFAELHAHPNGVMLAAWLLELPAYRGAA